MRYNKYRRGADCKGQLSIPFVKKIDRTVWKQGGQSFLLSSLFIWENFAMTSTVRRITSTTKLNNARMNVSNARVSKRVIRHPSLRLQGSGQGTFKKSFLPDLCLFYVEIEKPAIRDRKHDHQFCNQRLIDSISHFPTRHNVFCPPVSVPGVFIVNPLETLLLTICLPLRYTRAQMPCKFLTEGNFNL